MRFYSVAYFAFVGGNKLIRPDEKVQIVSKGTTDGCRQVLTSHARARRARGFFFFLKVNYSQIDFNRDDTDTSKQELIRRRNVIFCGVVSDGQPKRLCTLLGKGVSDDEESDKKYSRSVSDGIF